MPLIYIVEDDANIREIEQFSLGSAGAHIRTVRSVGYSFEKEQTP